MRLDIIPDWQRVHATAVTVDEITMRENEWKKLVWRVTMGDCDIATYTTKREAERHAARIRKALKGESE